jgi:hypothetical protein
MAVLFGLIIILGFVMSIVTLVAMVQIIVKAGYSGWWILVPLGAPVVVFIATFIVAASTADLGSRSLSSAFDALAVGVVIDFLVYAAVWVLFVKFAFSDWPVLQAARAPQAPRTNPYVGGPGPSMGGPGSYRPPGRPAPTSGPFPGVASPPPSPFPGGPPAPMTMQAQRAQPIGWHRVDETEDEQYWDGRGWAARRRRTANGPYVVIPLTD